MSKVNWPKSNELKIEGLNVNGLNDCTISVIKKGGVYKIVISNCKVKPVEMKVNYDEESKQIYIIGQMDGQTIVIN
ncbi:hypothetical protein KKC17_00385 [Patescibacteria group bacterium]|nr:hypothetical protein [Patescibacteria group bacterium]